jgi:hypothetical protein
MRPLVDTDLFFLASHGRFANLFQIQKPQSSELNNHLPSYTTM